MIVEIVVIEFAGQLKNVYELRGVNQEELNSHIVALLKAGLVVLEVNVKGR